MSVHVPRTLWFSILLLTGFSLFSGLVSAMEDNSIANATPIDVDGTTMQQSFDYLGDEDYLSFSAVQGRVYVLEARNVTSQATTDTMLALYAADGSLIVQNDDDLSQASTTNARIVHQASHNGTFYIRVSEFGGRSGGQYTVAVTKMGVLNASIHFPASAENVAANATFQMRTAVSCVDGPCGVVQAILDPQDAPKDKQLVDPQIMKELQKSDSVDVIVVFNTTKGTSVKQSKRTRERGLPTVHAAGFQPGREYTTIPAMAGSVTAEGLAQLQDNPSVAYIAYDTPVHATLGSSVPSIGVPAVWAQQVGGTNITGAGVTICVLDSGIDYTHPDFGS